MRGHDRRARMSTENEIVVVGAGAAGLWAAWRAAQAGRRVLLLEKTPRTGTKILASGGTRCNLTTTLDARPAAELFGPEGARFLATAFRTLPPGDVRRVFDELGVATVEAPLEKIFPASGRARDVRDALEHAARAAGVRIVCDAAVTRVERSSDTWELAVLGEHGVESRVRAPRLVLCPGGMSYPKSGTTGDGYAWLRALDLPLVPPVPALVPLTSPAAWVHELSGIALQDVSARLVDAQGRVLGARARPVLFTHRGVSGPGAMDLSTPVARAEMRARERGERSPELTLELDLVPDRSREELRALFIDAASRPGAPSLSRVLGLELPRRVLERVVVQAGLAPGDPKVNGLDKRARHELVEAFKSFRIPIDGTTGFDHAEVTAGGLALTHVEAGTLRVKGHAGLYVCGELLDLQGPIGGLNFQAAFATAELAARDAVKP